VGLGFLTYRLNRVSESHRWRRSSRRCHIRSTRYDGTPRTRTAHNSSLTHTPRSSITDRRSPCFPKLTSLEWVVMTGLGLGVAFSVRLLAGLAAETGESRVLRASIREAVVMMAS